MRPGLAPWIASLLAVSTSVGCESRKVITVEVESVELTPSSITVPEGESRGAQAIARESGGRIVTGRAVTWSTEHPGIATVDDEGTVSGLVEGETTLEATVEGVVGTASVSVIPGPSIELSESGVTLSAVEGGTSGGRTVGVSNGGNGQISGLSTRVSYSEGEPAGWLTAGLDRTTVPATLSISASAAALDVGTYGARVAVESPVGGGIAAELEVQLEVAPAPPSIALDIDEVAFGAVQGGQLPAVQAIVVTNGGGGILSGLAVAIEYAEGEPGDWLQADLALPLAPTVLSLRAFPGPLTAGTYHATVRLTSSEASNSPRTVPVEFQVTSVGTVPSDPRSSGPTGEAGSDRPPGGP